MVATARKLYQYKGFVQNKDDRPWFGAIFNNYLRDSTEESLSFGDQILYPQSDQSNCRLHIYYDVHMAFPKSIGYLSDTGFLMYNNVRVSIRYRKLLIIIFLIYTQMWNSFRHDFKCQLITRGIKRNFHAFL